MKFNFLYVLLLQITLQSNVNDNASELNTYFNKLKDSTVIICQYKISKVEVYNKGYRSEFYSSGNSMSISNDDLLNGRNTISVFTNKKIIVFNIIKNKPSVEVLNIRANDIKTFNNVLPSASLDIDIEPNNKLVVGYWILYEVNSSFGSHKSEFLSDLKYTQHLIRKNKIDIFTKNGRLNKLTVIEIYDLRGFMDLRAEGSYNKTPYYITN